MTTPTIGLRPSSQLPPQFAMMQLLTAHWAARAVQSAAELEIADELDSGPLTVEEIAARTGTDPVVMSRLLRALSTIGLFEITATGEVGQTPLSATLSARHPQSVGSIARLFGSDWHLAAWQQLTPSIRSATPAFELAQGQDLVSFLDDEPAAAETFDAGMTALAGLANPALRAAFGEAGLIADGPVVAISSGHSSLPLLVAGDLGTSLVLLDQARTVRRWCRIHDQQVTEGRLRCVTVELPGGVASALAAVGPASVVLLDRVLHDWPADDAHRLLSDIRAAAPPWTKVVVIEQLRSPGDPRTQLLDLQMFVHRGGAERTEEELTELVGTAGYTISTIIPSYSPMSLLVLDPDQTQ